MRVLLDLLRENRAAVQDMMGSCQPILYQASVYLKVLDPVLGERGVVEAWRVETNKYRFT